jgi:Carboxypeptidase regulatory-like domain
LKRWIAEPLVAAVLAVVVPGALFERTFAQTASNEGSAVVSGTVVDSVTRMPLKEVGVRARSFSPGRSSPQSGSATTDAEGHFTMNGLQPGRYSFSAMQQGYVGQRISGGGSNGRVLIVAPDQHTSDLVIELIPGANISGHIKNADGQPMPNVSVECVKYTGGGKDLHTVTSPSFTNPAGEYKIATLPPGRYFLRAIPPAPVFKNLTPPTAGAFTSKPAMNAPAAKTVSGKESGKEKSGTEKDRQAFAPTYYPSSTEMAGAAAMTVRAGEDLASVDITLTPVPAVRVSGKVTTAEASNAYADATVTLINNDASSSQREATTDGKGNFEFRGVPSGDYVLVARIESIQQHDKGFWGQRDLHVAESDVRVSMPLGPGTQVSGRLRIDEKSGLDLTGISASLQAEGNASVIALMPEVNNVTLRADGTFAFVDVPEGAYTLEFSSLPSGYYLKSAGSVDVLDTGITVAHNQAPPLIDLALSANSAQISGTVSNDSNPAAGAFVILVPEGNRSSQFRFYKRSMVDQSGRFSIRGIVPGDYKAIALMNPDRSVLFDTDFLQQFADRGETVHLQEGSTLTVSLDAIPADEATP